MNKQYELTNMNTGETKEVSAINARDALAQEVGLVALSIRGLDYYSGPWHTIEQPQWWNEGVQGVDCLMVQLTCECGQEFKLIKEEVQSVCTEITCDCGLTIPIYRGDMYYERRYQSFN